MPKRKRHSRKNDSSPQGASQPLLVSASVIAEEHSVSRRQVLKWRDIGVIDADVCIGRVIRFDPLKVREQLKEASN